MQAVSFKNSTFASENNSAAELSQLGTAQLRAFTSHAILSL